MSTGKRHTARNRRKRKKSSVKKYNHKKRKILFFLLILIIVCIFAAAGFVGKDDYSGSEYPVKGVDVSSYQLEIDWNGLQNEGIEFAFIKATEGSRHVDSRFAQNWEAVSRTDITAGAYHFMSYDTPGEKQAENFINTVEKKRNMLPPVVDVEFYGAYLQNHPNHESLYDVLNPLLEKLEDRYSDKPIIYTNTYIYNTYISASEKYNSYPVWLSDPDIPDTLPDGKEWTFCQYSFEGRSRYVADGKKNVDMNVFNGTKWDFKKFCWK